MKPNKWIFLAFLIPLLILYFSISGRVSAQTSIPATNTPLPPITPTAIATLTTDERLTALTTQVDELNKTIEHPPKDVWDKIESTSGLVSGLAVALIGTLATYVYNRREKALEDAQKRRELAVSQVEVVQTFMPQLQSGDEKAIEATLMAISALGNPELAAKLTALYQTDAAAKAITKLSSVLNEVAVQQAEKFLLELVSPVKIVVAKIYITPSFIITGLLANSDGYVITADHLLGKPEGTTKIVVNNKEYIANVVAHSDEKNLTLLRINTKDELQCLPLKRNISIQEGDQVVITRWEHLGMQITPHQISKVDRSLLKFPEQIFLETRRLITRVNAGAPVFNVNKEVIGVTVMKNGWNVFIVPIQDVLDFIEESIVPDTDEEKN